MWPGRARRCRWSILHICTLLNFQLLPELLPPWFQLQVVRFLGRGGGVQRIGCKYFTLAPAPCLPVSSCCCSCSSPALGVLMLCPPWRGLSAKNLTHFAQIFEFLHFICSPLRHFSLCCAGFLLLLLLLLLFLLLSARCFVSTLCELLASTAALSFSAFINLPALDSQLSSAPLPPLSPPSLCVLNVCRPAKNVSSA